MAGYDLSYRPGGSWYRADSGEERWRLEGVLKADEVKLLRDALGEYHRTASRSGPFDRVLLIEEIAKPLMRRITRLSTRERIRACIVHEMGT